MGISLTVLLYRYYRDIKRLREHAFQDPAFRDNKESAMAAGPTTADGTVVFQPAHCAAEVDALIEKFIGLRSEFGPTDLTQFIESNDAQRALDQAMDAMQQSMLPQANADLEQRSVEEYVVQLETAMRCYVELLINASQQGGDAVSRTHEMLQQIDSIFALVDGLRHIADQTGLLALNAAIEAARTGQVGRSYSFMAGEVQRLSAQSDSFGGDIRKEMGKARKSVQATKTLVGSMVVSDLNVALETRSGVDQLIGQLQSLSVLELNGLDFTEIYSKVIQEMHKIVVVVLMKLELIQRLGLVDERLMPSLVDLIAQLRSLYTSQVIKKTFTGD